MIIYGKLMRNLVFNIPCIETFTKFSYYSLDKQQIDSKICMKSVSKISIFMKRGFP